MKKTIFTTAIFVVMTLTIQSVFGQTKQLPQEVRTDFCKNAYYNYKYGTDAFKVWMTTSARNIGFNSIVDIEIAIENICNNKKLQDEFFQNVLRIGGSRDFIFLQFQSIGMTAVNAKTLTDYLIEKENDKTQVVTPKSITNNPEIQVNSNSVKKDEITGYPTEIYNPQPLQDNPSLGIIKWNVQGIEKLLSTDGSIKLPMTITKIKDALKVKPKVETDDYFPELSDYIFTLANGIVLSVRNVQENKTGWLIIEGENDKKISGLPFGLIINQSTIKDVEKQLSNIKTQKLGNYIEFRKGGMDYRFEFNKNKTLGKVHIL
ncbi:MAG: hypothetical protein H6Q19_1626 [Bacteroidetes bacterium]|nr:hypothetical protein [Bacteroidota bacterium]